MKQKLICVLSLVAMAWSSAVYAAERVAPTLPTAQTPEPGKSYWIYNVGTGLFINSSGTTPLLKTTGDDFNVKTAEGGFKLFNYSQECYLCHEGYYNDSFVFYDSGTHNCPEATFRIGYAESGDTLQCLISSGYLGYYEDGNRKELWRCEAGNITWKFFLSDEAAHYTAEVRLYNELESLGGTALESLKEFRELYEALYANRASATTEELINAAEELRTYKDYQAPSWNEYPIIFNSYTTGTYFEREIRGNSSSTLTATVKVDQDATFVYELDGPSGGWYWVDVYVDDIQTRSLRDNMAYGNYFWEAGNYDRFFEKLSTGTHTIKWVFSNSHASDYKRLRIRNIGCVATPLVEVSLLEPGSLGTEVLYNVNHVKDVKRLKVSGPMNDDDWAKIKMMTNLFELDMKDAITNAVPKSQFDGVESASAKMFLNKVILPDTLKTIGSCAFRNSYVEDVTFPRHTTTIGEDAFYHTHIKEAILPDSLESLGQYAFSQNYQCQKIDLGKKITKIPSYCFYDNYYAQITLPNTIEEVESHAFDHCHTMNMDRLPSSLKTIGDWAFGYCQSLNAALPEGLTYIGNAAFGNNYALESLILPNSIKTIGSNAFSACGLSYVEFPTSFYSILSNDILDVPTRLRLNSPTVVLHSHTLTGDIANTILEVPSHLVNSYKLDPYWYNAKAIEGFSTAEIQDWTINQPLVLNARDRFEGNPNITIIGANDRLPSLKINGDAPQEINNLYFYGNRKNYTNYPGQILSNSNYVKVNGNVSTDLETDEKRWFFFSLPFDVKVSDIAPANGAQYAIRYYDGANRAANGASGSWKNFGEDDIIPAGTGFIYQTNISTWSRFLAVDNANKQNVVSNKEVTLTLQENASDNAANKGWNLIGNPYQCYYNNHMLNFTAPITVWDAGNRTYTAYSLTDDDYAIRPNEAFFVQCPNKELNTISFPLQGRQLNAVIESQNAANARTMEGATARQLIDLEVSNGEFSDKTRVVVNEEATRGYDMGCDASKFMSADAPQIYTIGEDGTEYAINERPMDEGEVQLGFYTQKSGAFTLSMPRCQAKKVYLVDEFEHLTVDLTAQDYGFTAAEGKQEARFRLVVDAGEATGIESISTTLPQGEKAYNLNGQRVDGSYKGIVIKNGKKYLAK